MTATTTRARQQLGLWRLAWRVSQHEPRSFWLGWAAFVVFFTHAGRHRLPAEPGLRRPRRTATTPAVYRWALAVAVAETVRMASIHFGAITWTKAWTHMQTLLRANLLTAQVASGGPEAGQPVGSAGEALTHFRDDTEDVAMLVDGMVDVSGGLVFTVLAGFLLGSADADGRRSCCCSRWPASCSTTRALDGRIKAYRAADRAATAAVTGLVGDLMAAATTVKVNNATDAMLDRLRGLVDHRRETAVRDRVLDEGVMAFSQGSADVGLGLVLLVSAGALAVRRRSTSARWRCSSPTSAGSASCRGWSGGCWPAASRRRSPSTACASSSPGATPPTPCGRGRCRWSAASAACRPTRGPARTGAAAAPRGARPRGALPGRRRRPRHLRSRWTAAASSC